MINKSLNKKEQFRLSQKIPRHSKNCKVSQASNEIMLDRFYNGKKIEFPFAQYL